MTKRTLSHDDVAREIVMSANLTDGTLDALIKDIATALQDAFNMGFRAGRRARSR